jgi:hypothetical protein
MIAWACKQNKEKFPDKFHMMKDLGEHWGGEYCIYCLKIEWCGDCKLFTNKWCCNGFWLKMYHAKTWGTWIKYAKLVRQYIVDNG